MKDGLSPNVHEIRGLDRYHAKIRPFKPEEADYIIRRHRDLYADEYGFDSTFESYVGDAVRKFLETYDEGAENIWIAESQGQPVGSIAIVRVDDTTSQLRWFLIEPEMRGKGLGNRLMETAVEFCREKNYKLVYLWTLSILEAARHLYKRYGFELTGTEEHDIWGKHLIEERWDLKL
ncbi:MAG: hypothetical protein HPY66_3380 [Firmicutes bacterium]|nr:hypothetical protein [Bacillota bacterium]MDI6706276.1 GNAT family N-acetyltransferase [Bacillota bacterium]